MGFVCELCFYVSYVGLYGNCVSMRIQKGGLSPPILLVAGGCEGQRIFQLNPLHTPPLSSSLPLL